MAHQINTHNETSTEHGSNPIMWHSWWHSQQLMGSLPAGCGKSYKLKYLSMPGHDWHCMQLRYGGKLISGKPKLQSSNEFD